MISTDLSKQQLIEISLSYLKQGAEEKDHAMHLVVFSTLAKGKPNSRYVVWRQFNENTVSGWVYTDARSNKISELQQNPQAQLLFYDHGKKCQIKIDAKVSVCHQDQQSKEVYKNLKGGKESYNTLEPPGTSKESFERSVKMKEDFNAEDFAILEVKFLKMEVLQLNKPNHIRFSYHFKSKEFSWLVP